MVQLLYSAFHERYIAASEDPEAEHYPQTIVEKL